MSRVTQPAPGLVENHKHQLYSVMGLAAAARAFPGLDPRMFVDERHARYSEDPARDDVPRARWFSVYPLRVAQRSLVDGAAFVFWEKVTSSRPLPIGQGRFVLYAATSGQLYLRPLTGKGGFATPVPILGRPRPRFRSVPPGYTPRHLPDDDHPDCCGICGSPVGSQSAS